MSKQKTINEQLGLYIGGFSGITVTILSLFYAVVLGIGLLTLPSTDQPIQNPWFTMMEILILLIAPTMVAWVVGLHSWVPSEHKSLSLLSIIFMSLCTLVTECVHFAVLILSHEPTIRNAEWFNAVFSFQWPSVVYALDILAWDFFFPLATLFSAMSISGLGLQRLARNLLYLSAALAFIGLIGVPMGDMNVRNIGIVGYAVVFPVATLIMAIVFKRNRPSTAKTLLSDQKI